MSRSGVAAAAKRASPIRQVRLRGASVAIDRRGAAARSDLADLRLADRVAAAHYVEPVARRCVALSAMMRTRPAADAPAVSELLLGEDVELYELAGGWAWVRCATDGYVGYVEAAALGAAEGTPTHRVAAPSALVFGKADIKCPAHGVLPLNARIVAHDHDERFLALSAGGFVHRRHVATLGEAAADPVAVAQNFLGTPYLWGGRTRAGIDCSGLVQAALIACGHACPRDSDQQRAALGGDVDPVAVRRGDIVFFPGHVGLMASATDLLHANAFWMTTLVEPLAGVVARLAADHAAPVLAVKRL